MDCELPVAARGALPGALPGVLGPETIGAEGGAVCFGVVGEVAELGGLGGMGELGGGEDEQPTRNAAIPANDSFNK